MTGTCRRAAGNINHPIKEKLHKIEIRLVWLEEKKMYFFQHEISSNEI